MRTAPTGAAAMAAHMSDGRYQQQQQHPPVQGGWADGSGAMGFQEHQYQYQYQCPLPPPPPPPQQQQQQQQEEVMGKAREDVAFDPHFQLQQQQHQGTQYCNATDAGEPDYGSSTQGGDAGFDTAGADGEGALPACYPFSDDGDDNDLNLSDYDMLGALVEEVCRNPSAAPELLSPPSMAAPAPAPLAAPHMDRGTSTSSTGSHGSYEQHEQHEQQQQYAAPCPAPPPRPLQHQQQGQHYMANYAMQQQSQPPPASWSHQMGGQQQQQGAASNKPKTTKVRRPLGAATEVAEPEAPEGSLFVLQQRRAPAATSTASGGQRAMQMPMQQQGQSHQQQHQQQHQHQQGQVGEANANVSWLPPVLAFEEEPPQPQIMVKKRGRQEQQSPQEQGPPSAAALMIGKGRRQSLEEDVVETEEQEEEEDEEQEGNDEEDEHDEEEDGRDSDQQGRFFTRKWAQAEDERLRLLMKEFHKTSAPPNWDYVAASMPGRTAAQCQRRWMRVKYNNRGCWTPEEDHLLKQLVMCAPDPAKLRWISLAEKLPGRRGKQCRERWFNHLDPSIKRTEWTVEEDRILIQSQRRYGNRWAEIARMLPGRPENSVKNRWYSNAIKKLLAPPPENDWWHPQDKEEGHGQAPLPPPKKLQPQPLPPQQLQAPTPQPLPLRPIPKAAKPKVEAPASPARAHPAFGSPFANFDERSFFPRSAAVPASTAAVVAAPRPIKPQPQQQPQQQPGHRPGQATPSMMAAMPPCPPQLRQGVSSSSICSPATTASASSFSHGAPFAAPPPLPMAPQQPPKQRQPQHQPPPPPPPPMPTARTTANTPFWMAGTKPPSNTSAATAKPVMVKRQPAAAPLADAIGRFLGPTAPGQPPMTPFALSVTLPPPPPLAPPPNISVASSVDAGDAEELLEDELPTPRVRPGPRKGPGKKKDREEAAKRAAEQGISLEAALAQLLAEQAHAAQQLQRMAMEDADLAPLLNAGPRRGRKPKKLVEAERAAAEAAAALFRGQPLPQQRPQSQQQQQDQQQGQQPGLDTGVLMGGAHGPPMLFPPPASASSGPKGATTTVPLPSLSRSSSAASQPEHHHHIHVQLDGQEAAPSAARGQKRRAEAPPTATQPMAMPTATTTTTTASSSNATTTTTSSSASQSFTLSGAGLGGAAKGGRGKGAVLPEPLRNMPIQTMLAVFPHMNDDTKEMILQQLRLSGICLPANAPLNLHAHLHSHQHHHHPLPLATATAIPLAVYVGKEDGKAAMADAAGKDCDGRSHSTDSSGSCSGNSSNTGFLPPPLVAGGDLVEAVYAGPNPPAAQKKPRKRRTTKKEREALEAQALATARGQTEMAFPSSSASSSPFAAAPTAMTMGAPMPMAMAMPFSPLPVPAPAKKPGKQRAPAAPAAMPMAAPAPATATGEPIAPLSPLDSGGEQRDGVVDDEDPFAVPDGEAFTVEGEFWDQSLPTEPEAMAYV